jgi:hypothetical protein
MLIFLIELGLEDYLCTKLNTASTLDSRMFCVWSSNTEIAGKIVASPKMRAYKTSRPYIAGALINYIDKVPNGP